MIICLLTPCIIFNLYKLGSYLKLPPNTCFDEQDILSYSGAVFSLFGTLYLGFVTLKQNENLNHINEKLMRLQEDDLHQKNRPFIMMLDFGKLVKPTNCAVYDYFTNNTLQTGPLTQLASLSFLLTNLTSNKFFVHIERCVLTVKKSSGEFIREHGPPNYKKQYFIEPEELAFIELTTSSDLFNSCTEGDKIELIIVLKNGFGKEYEEHIELLIHTLDLPLEDRPTINVSPPSYAIYSVSYIDEKRILSKESI